MLMTLGNFLKNFLPQPGAQLVHNDAPRRRPPLQPLGLDEFLNLYIPPRQMLLSPILPERSLAMLYAPRGVGKTLLGLSIGLAVASGSPLLRWSTPHPRRVLYVDGEMPSGVVARTAASDLARIKWRGSQRRFPNLKQPTTWKAESISALSKDSVRSTYCWKMLTC